MSNRKTITEFLGKLLYEEKLCGMGMYWAKEVVVDYGSSKAKTKRIDFMQYIPDGQCDIFCFFCVDYKELVILIFRSCRNFSLTFPKFSCRAFS